VERRSHGHDQDRWMAGHYHGPTRLVRVRRWRDQRNSREGCATGRSFELTSESLVVYHRTQPPTAPQPPGSGAVGILGR
jgi:hypothetical protein